MNILYCENCKHELDAHSNLEDKNLKPKDGDISVCLYCGYLASFKNGIIVPLPYDTYYKLDRKTKDYIRNLEIKREQIMKEAQS